MNNFFLSAPLTINISLSYKCNFNCNHCYSREILAKDELGFEDFKKISEILSDWKVPFLNIGGGEPLLVSWLFDFVKFSSQKGLHCSMNSNGYLLDKEKAREIRKAGFTSVGISIDSPREEVHDSFRNKKGSFSRALSALENLAEENVKTTVSMVISKLNKDDFQDIIPIIKKYKVKQLYLHNYKCSGMGYKNMAELDLSPQEWKDFYKRALEVRKNNPDITISFDDPIMHLLPDYNERPLVRGSTCGKLSLNIHSNGDITPCGFMSVTIGNILKDDIIKLWKDSPVLNALRNPTPKGKCASCNIYENCLGGCKARAFIVAGDFNNPDPHCWKEGGDNK